MVGFHANPMPRHKVVVCIALAGVFALAMLVSCSGKSSGADGQVQPPVTSSSAEDKNYADIQLQFENAGFTNVHAEGLGDLVTGWLHKEGDVKEVSVNGKTNYSKSEWVNPDAKVVIRYHSYPEKSASQSSNAKEGSDSKSSAAFTEPSSSSTVSVGAEKSASTHTQKDFDVTSYVNQPLLAVCDDLKAQGVAFDLVHEITQMDMTSAYEFGDFNDGDMVVTNARKNSDGSVTLTIISASLAEQQRR